jgi:hypothetical protein
MILSRGSLFKSDGRIHNFHCNSCIITISDKLKETVRSASADIDGCEI